jgi:C-terminal processing protease CtpA/Prc
MPRPRRFTVSHRLLLALVAAALAWCPATLHAAEKGWFGVAFSIDTEGISLNPKLRSVKIEKILPRSPAANSDLAPGDVVLEIEGIAVEGAKADMLKADIQKAVGETLRLKVKRGADVPHEVALIAAAKPPG